ncbi:response regulator [Zoogloea sp.]|uniref:response regulator n=1 Tax=Zoogloea sp. TaxID=49181 RepID=UPI0025EA4DE8|nr:response regulator [Zoogloea sp.]MCK6394451.1 response regulator [Zoogloea sp.]
MHSPAPPAQATPQLLFQPRFDGRSGALVGAKLYLARPGRPDNVVVQHAALEDLLPLQVACRLVSGWNTTHRQRIILTVGARLEVLCAPAFSHILNSVLLESRLEPDCLELNIITEQGEVPDTTAAALCHLKACGVRFTISAASQANALLAWIGRLPVDCIEVPAGLVQDVTTDPEGVAIVRALVTRAHRMKLSVNAKGIRNAQVAAVMQACGCDYLQGPLLGQPLMAEDFEHGMVRDMRLDGSLLRGPSAERTLLLVDDEENILSSLRRLLRRDGYTILTATSGQQGLEALATNRVDVIVSDQRMPGMTGVEFLHKAKDMYPDTVRLVLSGYTDLQSVTDAINEGAIYKFLTKPWDDAMLRANIEEAFRRKALSDDNQRLAAELQHANRELERINERLTSVLADRERRLGMDEAALSLTQEALAVMPLPVLGVDPGGMIAFANRAAEKLFPDQAPLLGLGAEDVLPEAFFPLLQASTGQADLLCGSRQFRVEAHPLGGPTASRGCLLTFNGCASTP